MALLVFCFAIPSSYGKDCNIFVHGYTSDGKDYFGDLPRQVIWDSNQKVELAAPELAEKITEKMGSCDPDSRVVIRAHSYGVAVTHYILGKGRQFQDLHPNHPFVFLYKSVSSVYSYTGAFHGTPLMDLVCSGGVTRYVGRLIGKKCVRTLTTSRVGNVSSMIRSSGVPTHLIYSTDDSGHGGIMGKFISKHFVSWWDYLFKGVRNQNDNTLPIYSTRGCAEKKLMPQEDSNCEKLDSNFFIDFYHTQSQHHTEFVKDEAFMLMKNHRAN